MFSTSDKKSAGGHPVVSAKKDSNKPAGPAPNPVWQSLALNSAGIQAKLTVSQPDDPYELEADSIADKVMRMAVPPAEPSPNSNPASGVAFEQAQRKRDPDEKEADEVAHKVSANKPVGISGPVRIDRNGNGKAKATPEFQSQLEASKGGGQPLPHDVHIEMGNRMGTDLSDVRVHTGSTAHEMSESINAKAFTHGQDIYFKSSNYDPGSKEGKELLAHELVHTLQQAKGCERAIQRSPVPQTAWENDKSAVGKDIYYNTEAEANIRKANLENNGKWEEYAVESFTKDGKAYWRVHMRGKRTMANFLTVLRKAEKANPSWTKEQMVNSLRRLGGYDTVNFQKMYGTTAAADIVAVPALGFDATDVQQLRGMVRHEGSDEKEAGIVKDFSGEYLAMGHVMTGVSGGLHRNKEADLAYKYLPAGEKIDNLYATTLTGDLGQSAVRVNEGKQKGYVGAGTEATEAELVGDIDGVIIGEAFAAAEFKKNWDATKSLSDFIQKYYDLMFRQRFIHAATFSEAYLVDQTTRFAESYAYPEKSISGAFTGAFSSVGPESKASYKAYKDWLSQKKTQADKKPQAVFSISADNVQLLSNPPTYSNTVDCKLMKGTQVGFVDDGVKMSFNQGGDEMRRTKVLVLIGENEGKIGWVLRKFLKKSS